jgi:hypothetical protein
MVHNTNSNFNSSNNNHRRSSVPSQKSNRQTSNSDQEQPQMMLISESTIRNGQTTQAPVIIKSASHCRSDQTSPNARSHNSKHKYDDHGTEFQKSQEKLFFHNQNQDHNHFVVSNNKLSHSKNKSEMDF